MGSFQPEVIIPADLALWISFPCQCGLVRPTGNQLAEKILPSAGC